MVTFWTNPDVFAKVDSILVSLYMHARIVAHMQDQDTDQHNMLAIHTWGSGIGFDISRQHQQLQHYSSTLMPTVRAGVRG